MPFSPGLNWTRNDSAGPLTATLSGALFARRQRSESSTETVETALADGSLLQAERETTRTADRRTGLNATGRLQWRLSDSGDTLLLAPSLFHSSARSDRRFTLQQDAPATPPAYDLADSQGRSSFTNLRLNTQWRQRLGAATRLELNGNGGAWRARGDSVRQEFRDDGTLLRTLHDSSRTREHTLALNAKLSQTLGGSDAGPASTADSAHSLVSGLETEAVRRREQRSGDLQADDATGNLQASSLRLAAYVQDEWSLTPTLGAARRPALGRHHHRRHRGDGSRPRNRSSVATPLLHVLWKPDPKGRDQVRFSLTRSYRSPALGTLIGNTTINSKFDPSGPNEATSPDRAGNPALQPELATGIDLALERYLAGGGLLSANVFHRRIQRPDAQRHHAGDRGLQPGAALGGAAAEHRRRHHAGPGAGGQVPARHAAGRRAARGAARQPGPVPLARGRRARARQPARPAGARPPATWAPTTASAACRSPWAATSTGCRPPRRSSATCSAHAAAASACSTPSRCGPSTPAWRCA